MKKIIIIGGTSGIGKEIAERYAQRGDRVGITGRRTALLEEIQQKYPGNIHIRTMDICKESSVKILQSLIEEMEGVDIIFINSGYGKQVQQLEPEIESKTIHTNILGFTDIIVFAYNYFRRKSSGHIVVTSSVASVRALRQAPAYSASKRYIRHYVDCLAQRAKHEKLNLKFTTLMPGFIDTDFIKSDIRYPLVIPLDKAGDIIFKAIEKEKRAIYLPFRWKIIVFFWNLIPQWLWERC